MPQTWIPDKYVVLSLWPFTAEKICQSRFYELHIVGGI